MLTNGGSMVTRLSPDNEDFSIVLEKMTSANSVCARGSNPTSTATTEDVTVQLQGSFLKAAGAIITCMLCALREDVRFRVGVLCD